MNARNAIEFRKLVIKFWNDNIEIKMATWYTDLLAQVFTINPLQFININPKWHFYVHVLFIVLLKRLKLP